MAERAEEAAKLLGAALAMDRDGEELKSSIETKRKERGKNEDANTAAVHGKQRKLEGEVDRLLARVMDVEEKLKLLRNGQKLHSEGQSTLQRQGEDVEEIRGSLMRMHTMLAMKNDPNTLFLTPPCSFTVEDFEERKANEEIWYSPPFYSHPMGYKMCLKLYLNGHGESAGTHLSVFIIFMPGEFDDLLSWPFCGMITVQLLNQRRSNRGHISHVVNMTDFNSFDYRQKPNPKVFARLGDLVNAKSWGILRFAALNVVCAPCGYFADTEYLKEGKLLVRVWKIDLYLPHH